MNRRAKPVALDDGDDLDLVERFDVRRVPTLVLFRDGEPVAKRDEGFVGADELVAWVTDAGDDASTDGTDPSGR